MKIEKPMRILLAALLCASAVAYLGPYAWWADLFAHFRPHYAGLAVLLALGFAVRKSVRGGIICCAVAAISLPPLIQDVNFGGERPVDPGLRVIAWNANHRASGTAEGLKMIAARHADIVILLEPSDGLRRDLPALDRQYPYQKHADACGFAGCEVSVLSRRPWRRVRTEILAPRTPPVIVAEYDAAGDTPAFHLVAVHLTNVINGRGGALQLSQIAALGEAVRALDGPVVMAGDMNAAPSSALFRAISAQTGLNSAATTLWGTWPALLGPFGIAIDHFFVRGVEAIAVERLGAFGSDHHALEAAIAIPTNADKVPIRRNRNRAP